MTKITKCLLFWKKVAEFKERNDFDGFREWCGFKSYEQARRDWNALDTFGLIAEKLGKDVCEVVAMPNISENALLPIIHQREEIGTVRTETATGEAFGKHLTKPSPIQEKAIEILLPKILKGEVVTQSDSMRALKQVEGKKIEEEALKPKKCPIELFFQEEVQKKLLVKRDDQLKCENCVLQEPCKETMRQLESFAQSIVEAKI